MIIISERPSPKPCKPYAERDEADGNTEDFRYYPDVSIRYYRTVLKI